MIENGREERRQTFCAGRGDMIFVFVERSSMRRHYTAELAV